MITAETMNTRDLGLAIRDFIEGNAFQHFDDEGEGTSRWARVDFVDCSDPNNLQVHLSTGEFFTVRVVRTA